MNTFKEAGTGLFSLFDTIDSIDVNQNKSVVRAQIVTELIKYDGPQHEFLTPETSLPDELYPVRKFAQCKVRILDPNMAHEKLLKPWGDGSTAKNPAKTKLFESLLPTMILPEQQWECLEKKDIVFVRLRPGDNNMTYGLQYCDFESLDVRWNSAPSCNDQCLIEDPDPDDECYDPVPFDPQKIWEEAEEALESHELPTSEGSYPYDSEPFIYGPACPTAAERDAYAAESWEKCGWWNRGKIRTSTWTYKGKDDKYKKYDGTAMENGKIPEKLMEKWYHGGKTTKLLIPAMEDFKKLDAAFIKKFPGSKGLIGSGYRSYESQVLQRKRRAGNCGNSSYPGTGVEGAPRTSASSIGQASTPGQSNHGWGAAIDVERKTWDNYASEKNQTTKAKKMELRSKASQFKWLNKYAPDYNFAFATRNEHWHLDWTRLKEFLAKPTPPPRSWAGYTSWFGPKCLDDKCTGTSVYLKKATSPGGSEDYSLITLTGTNTAPGAPTTAAASEVDATAEAAVDVATITPPDEAAGDTGAP